MDEQLERETILDLGDNITLRLVLVPAGKFIMGSPVEEKGRYYNESPEHEVAISKPFYFGIYAVTQQQFEQVMGQNPSRFREAQNPVESVRWNEAVEFCTRLSQKTGKTVQLPTEAQWEYACRAGTTTPFHTGQTISTDEANYDGNYTCGDGQKGKYRKTTIAVGSFKPNAFGLYDMVGNAAQWCLDLFDDKYSQNESIADPQGPDYGTYRVVRGGGWNAHPRACRSAYRDGKHPGLRREGTGFRVVVVVGGGQVGVRARPSPVTLQLARFNEVAYTCECGCVHTFDLRQLTMEGGQNGLDVMCSTCYAILHVPPTVLDHATESSIHGELSLVTGWRDQVIFTRSGRKESINAPSCAAPIGALTEESNAAQVQDESEYLMNMKGKFEELEGREPTPEEMKAMSSVCDVARILAKEEAGEAVRQWGGIPVPCIAIHSPEQKNRTYYPEGSMLKAMEDNLGRKPTPTEVALFCETFQKEFHIETGQFEKVST
jgi:formylglycine-generating enzyme required for sulfatase activity